MALRQSRRPDRQQLRRCLTLVAGCAALAALCCPMGGVDRAFLSPPGGDASAVQHVSRRGLLALPVLMAPASASARGTARIKGGPPEDPMNPGLPPAEIDSGTEKAEVWESVTIGESSLVDPNDPKYKQLRILADIEKQKKKNEEYSSMTEEEKRNKMCELLGRGCQ